MSLQNVYYYGVYTISEGLQGMTGQDLKALRDFHGLTQRALGEILGYTANYIYRLERGKEPMTRRAEKLVRIVLKRKKTQKVSQTH